MPQEVNKYKILIAFISQKPQEHECRGRKELLEMLDNIFLQNEFDKKGVIKELKIIPTKIII